MNEHLCQTAAAALGLDAAPTVLEVFNGETCLVVKRFDRHEGEGAVRRGHFEDVCQALGLAPDRKYQSDGGPTSENIIDLLRHETDSGDVRMFFLSVFYNWLIGNTDGHSSSVNRHSSRFFGGVDRIARATFSGVSGIGSGILRLRRLVSPAATTLPSRSNCQNPSRATSSRSQRTQR